MNSIGTAVNDFLLQTGFAQMEWRQGVMILVALLFLYLAIKKGFEPLLLVPIAFGMLLANIPTSGVMAEPTYVLGEDGLPILDQVGGLLYYLYQGDHLGVFPPLIFLGIGAMTDFGPLIANPKALLLGAAAQLGVFLTFWGAIMIHFFIPCLLYTS